MREMFCPNTLYMRLPIALNGWNLVLLILIMAAPWLGKFARIQYRDLEERHKIREMSLLSSVSAQEAQKVDKPLPSLSPSRSQWLKNRAEKQEDETKDHSSNPLPDLKARPITQEARAAQVPVQDPAEFLTTIRRLAMEDRYQEAEAEFLKRIQDKNMSVLESLEKVEEFKNHYSKLRDHFSSSASKSM